MGTVGLSFGSATSGQGFDVAATVTQIQAAESAIETPWQNQLTALQAQDTVFTSLGSDLSTLTTSLQALTDFTGVMSQKEGSSSDENVLSLTSASTSAVAGSHTVTVTSLASTSSDFLNPIANARDTLSGTLTFAVGSGASRTITVDSSNNTLSTLAAAINSAGAGVTASVISDSSGSRLSLVSGTSGAAGQLSVSSALTDASATSVDLTTVNSGSPGADAVLNVDGISLTSASNTVNTAIPGVTFQLLAKSTSPVQVEITNNNSAIETAFGSLVSAYNSVVKDVSTQEGNDSSGNAEPLFGSPTLALIQSQLSSALTSSAASGSVTNIGQLGLSFNDDGTLSMDTDTLDSVLNSNFSDVTGFLQDTGSFGQTLTTTLNNLGTQAPNGAIFLAQQQNSAEEASLNQNITNENAVLSAQKTSLTDELNTANQILQSIPSQLNEINEIYSAVTGFNTTQNG
jgi:flagellar hook-associated protein 2